MSIIDIVITVAIIAIIIGVFLSMARMGKRSRVSHTVDTQPGGRKHTGGSGEPEDKLP